MRQHTGERQKYAVKKVCFNRVSNPEPLGHESDTLTDGPPRQSGKMQDSGDLGLCSQTIFNSLPNEKLSDGTKLNAVAEDYLHVDEKMISARTE